MTRSPRQTEPHYPTSPRTAKEPECLELPQRPLPAPDALRCESTVTDINCHGATNRRLRGRSESMAVASWSPWPTATTPGRRPAARSPALHGDCSQRARVGEARCGVPRWGSCTQSAGHPIGVLEVAVAAGDSVRAIARPHSVDPRVVRIELCRLAHDTTHGGSSGMASRSSGRGRPMAGSGSASRLADQTWLARPPPHGCHLGGPALRRRPTQARLLPERTGGLLSRRCSRCSARRRLIHGRSAG